MKTVLAHDYKYKKLVADNLQAMINKRYVEISDEEYARVNTAIESYSNAIQNAYDHLQDLAFTEPQKAKLLQDIEDLEADILKLKQNMFDTEETGFYFVDEEGNVGAKVTGSGLYAINLDGTSGSGSNVSSLNDLSDVSISSPSNGQSLLYNSTSNSWKNSTVSGGGGSVNLTVVDY